MPGGRVAAARAPVRRWILRTLVPVALAGSGCGLAGLDSDRFLWPWQGRAPHRYEWAYEAIAVDSGSPAPCGRIGRHAVTAAPFNSPGTRLSLMRSSCFRKLAINTSQPFLCDRVHSVSSLLYDGSRLGRPSCHQLASGRPGRLFIGASAVLEPERLLRELGYDEQDVHAACRRLPEPDFCRESPVAAGEVDWDGFLRAEARSGALLERLERLPDFSARDELH